jgi:hypothetical protein
MVGPSQIAGLGILVQLVQSEKQAPVTGNRASAGGRREPEEQSLVRLLSVGFADAGEDSVAAVDPALEVLLQCGNGPIIVDQHPCGVAGEGEVRRIVAVDDEGCAFWPLEKSELVPSALSAGLVEVVTWR